MHCFWNLEKQYILRWRGKTYAIFSDEVSIDEEENYDDSEYSKADESENKDFNHILEPELDFSGNHVNVQENMPQVALNAIFITPPKMECNVIRYTNHETLELGKNILD